MLEMIPLGALKKERKQIGDKDKTDMSKTFLPPNDMCLLLHDDILLGSAPIGKPISER